MGTKVTESSKFTLKDISKFSEITDNTVKNAYRDIYPRIREVIPKSIPAHLLENLPTVNLNG
jgi:hypothetical protein